MKHQKISGPVRLGIAGLGNMGAAHARSVLAGDVPRMRLTAVCDYDAVRFPGYEGVRTFADPGAMIRSGEIDAILIATPHYTHTTMGIDALGQGLHVLVEKPISVHKRDCEKLIAAHRGDAVFAAMFNQRTDPFYQKIRGLIRNGEMGEIRRVNWIITNWFRTEAYYASGGWRATWAGEGGGVLLNQCPHNLDLLQWMFGMPASVRAFCRFGQYHDIEVEDDVTAYLQFKNGATGVFITTTGEAPGTNRLEIAGERGRLVYENDQLRFTRNEVEMTAFSRKTDQGFATPPTWDVRIPVAGHGEQHIGILKNFAEAILDGAPLIAPGAEGIHSVELANAMLFSTFTGRTIELPLDGKAYEGRLKKLIAASRVKKKKAPAGKAGREDFAKSFH
ncbi:MAG TPA: Gfo/Idh/MocA family oxidoreductase [Chthoniobacteraceae bacterium]|jgi:predicted dehydrogenase|nr:Gfo/Idh/MocA family oxidoreductase [Chthoniobacteraceae bacterium]